MTLAPVPATLLLAGLAGAALAARHVAFVGVLAVGLLAACLRAEPRRRRPYVLGALVTGAGVFVLSPLVAVEGVETLWQGPVVPVLGRVDVTVEELGIAALNGLRLTAVTLAFSAYALLVDHDRLVAAARVAPRSALAVALATRLVPSLERDASGLREAVLGRGVALQGIRGHARLLSPLVAGSLERAMNLAEAMEARGYGRPGRTVAPGAPWRRADRIALVVSLAVLAGALLWR